MAGPARYRAFISYKHVRSSGFAERLELALKAYAKPLWQPPPAIFRDEKYLKPGLDLPKMISDALEQSEFLVYLASPDAARSHWVEDELRQWCSRTERREKLIIVLTEGEIAIGQPAKTIDWERTNAIPEVLRGVLERVPYYLDCTHLAAPERQTLLDPDFKKVVNAIVAAFRGIDPIEMYGQEILQHRRNVRTRNALAATVVMATLLAVAGAGTAVQQAREAAAQARISRASQLAGDAEAAARADLPQRALLLAAAAAEVTRREGEGITVHAEQTLRDLLASVGGYGLSAHRAAIDRLLFLGGGRRLLSLDTSGQAVLWELDGHGSASGHVQLLAPRGRILAVQLSADEKIVRFVSESGRATTKSLDPNPRTLSEHDLRGFARTDACGTKFPPSRALQLTRDGVLRVWNTSAAPGAEPSAWRIAADTLGGCVFSSDGAWLYAEPDEGTPVLVRGTGGEPFPLREVAGEVVAVAFDAQSRQLAISVDSGRLFVWRLDGPRPRFAFAIAGKPDESETLAFSRSGRILAAAGERGTVRLWRIEKTSPVPAGSVTVPFEVHQQMDSRLAFERDDTLLIASDGLRAAAAIPLRDGAPLPPQVLFTHPSADDVSGDRATPYALHPTRPLLAAAGNRHHVTLWAIEGTELRRRNEPLRGHERDVLDLAFSPDGRWLATAGHDRTIRLWPVDPPQWVAAPAHLAADPADFTLNERPPNPGGGVWLADFFADEEWLESYPDVFRARFARIDRRGRLTEARTASWDGSWSGGSAEEADRLRLASRYPPFHRRLADEWRARASLPARDDDAPLDVDEKRGVLAEAERDGTIHVWRGGQRSSHRGLRGPIVSVSVDAAAGALAALDARGQLAIWRIGQSRPARVIAAVDAGEDPTLRILGGKRWLYLSGRKGAYLIDTGAQPRAWRLPAGAHQIGPVGDCCVMQLFDGRFELRITSDGLNQPVRVDPGAATGEVTAFDYDSLRRRLLLGYLDGRVIALDLDAAGAVVRSMSVTAHDFPIGAVALGAGGNIVAAGSIAGITMTQTGDRGVVHHVRLKGHRGDVDVLRFSPAGQWLVSGGEDNATRIHPVSADRVLELACLAAGRTLTAVEASRLGDDPPRDVCAGVLRR